MAFNYDKLRSAIERSGYQKKALSIAVGRPGYYLNDVLRQKNKIPQHIQEALAEKLGVTVEWLNDQQEPEQEEQVREGSESVRREIMALLFTKTDEELREFRDHLKGKK